MTTNPQPFENLRALLTQSLNEHEKLKESMSRLGPKTEPGDLYIFKVPRPVPVQWCVIFSHSQDANLWFVVPCDEFSLVGTRDVALPDNSQFGPLRFRCVCGLWVHQSDISVSNRVGRIEFKYVEQVRDHLARILNNDRPTVQAMLSTDEDPDYLDWIEELTSAVDEFEQALSFEDGKESVVIVHASSAVKDWYESILGLEQLSSLAADSTDEMDFDERPPGICLPYSGTGDLVAIIDDQCVEFQLFNASESVKPELVLHGTDVKVDWNLHESEKLEWFSTSRIPWSNSQITIRIGDRMFVVQRQVSDE